MRTRFAQLVAGIRAAFRGRRNDLELDEELRGFVDASAEAKVRSGLPPDRARREALLETGGVEQVKERVRDAGWESVLPALAQDIRYGLRVMRRTPVVTIAAVLSLTLGIGANTAIFTLLDAVAWRHLPVERPDELRRLGMLSPGNSEPNPTFTNVLWEHVRDRQDVFSSVFAWGEGRMDLADGGEARYATTLFASGGYFDGIGVKPAAGRVLHPADDARGCDGAAVLGYDFWQSHYGGDPSVVGRSLTLNRFAFPIVGVSQPGFTGLNVGWKFDVAIPICAASRFDGALTRLDQRSWWWLNVVGRLKPELMTEGANARLSSLSPGIMDAAVPLNWQPDMQARFKKRVIVVAPAATGLSRLRRQYTEPLSVLFGIAGLVLVIACANIAALMLARASARRREIAVRLALGASRARLVRQLLTESVLLSTIGAVAGMFVARWGGAMLVRAISGRRGDVFLDLSPDVRVLAFTVVVGVASGLLFGLWPAIRATRNAPIADMKQGGLERTRGRRFLPGHLVASGQVALCLALLVVSGLLLRSFVKLVTVDLGFDRSGVLVASVAMPATTAAVDRPRIFESLQTRLAALPAVVSVSRSILTPLGPTQWDNGLNVEGPHRATSDNDTFLNYVSPAFFETLRMPIRIGRGFTAADSASAAPVAVVNEALARRFFGDEPALGRRFHLDASRGEAAPSVEIVGIVADARYNSLRGAFPAIAYFPIAQGPASLDASDFQIRLDRIDPMAFKRTVEAEALTVDRSLSLDFRTMDEQLGTATVQERLLAVLSTFFGAVALVLAGVGLYGAIAYAVARRQKDIGIRLALGASPGAIVGSVVAEVAVLLGAGLMVGTGLAILATGYTKTFLFELAPNDPATLTGAAAALTVVGLAAAFVPARRAARTDPLVSLRNE